MSLWRDFITDTLKAVNLPRSPAAVSLLGMIAAHESRFFTYAKQLRGPALGFWQMEPNTGYREVQRYVRLRFDRFHRRITSQIDRDPLWLVLDPMWACQCARIYLLSKPEALPEEEDIAGLGDYAKRYWNTVAGAATPEDYITAWETYCVDGA